MKYFKSLDVSNNQLESLNEDLMSKCTELRQINLSNAFKPDTKFSLRFLASLSMSLYKFELTLPDMPLDFSVFSSLNNLRELALESAARLDSNRERPNLTKELFRQLSDGVVKKLGRMCLSQLVMTEINN